MRLNYIIAVALLLMFDATFTGVAQSESGIQGVIKIGPTRAGPIKADTPASMPLANTWFVAHGKDGAGAPFETDGEGRFRVVLPAGHYTISLKGPRPAIGHFGPFSVEVAAGKITAVEWECDSGVR